MDQLEKKITCQELRSQDLRKSICFSFKINTMKWNFQEMKCKKSKYSIKIH